MVVPEGGIGTVAAVAYRKRLILYRLLQISELEQAADELVALESRAEMAEAEAEAAAESMAVMTPRPPRTAPAAEQLLGSEGVAALQAAALQYRQADRLVCTVSSQY